MPTRNISLKPRPYLLENKIQHYAWGARGDEAFIPRLLDIAAQDDLPYAELWMGTHPNAPSDVIVDGARLPLSQLIARYPREILGPQVCARFGGTLPFLFKALSAAEALSIQAHPDQEQARLLHAQDPGHYPDDNHKPEIAIALDSLTALVGFRSWPEIVASLEQHSELADFVGQQVVRGLREPGRQEPRELLRALYSTLIRRSLTHQAELAASINRLSQRLRRSGEPRSEQENIFLTLEQKYPADVGLYSVFLLNLVQLEQGQGVFIGAGIPHAYLLGNIIECMATSDNVVRAGLTPKYKDVETLVDLLTFESGPVSILEGSPEQDTTVYHAPVSEFQVSRWRVDKARKVTGKTLRVLLVTQGEVLIRWGGDEMALRRGQSVLIPSLLDEFELTSSSAECFQAEVPL